jgi:hypothetical protein
MASSSKARARRTLVHDGSAGEGVEATRNPDPVTKLTRELSHGLVGCNVVNHHKWSPWHRQTSHAPNGFAGDSQRLAAGRLHDQRWQSLQETVGRVGTPHAAGPTRDHR